MNFESREQEGIRDKSFHSSNDSIHIEEKLSLHSINGSVKSVGSWKSLSAIMNLEREDEIKLSCRRKLVSADWLAKNLWMNFVPSVSCVLLGNHRNTCDVYYGVC